ncbi:membrane protein [Pseudomonas syringae pv. actinidiae ICMP 19079]|nr:membrane protein [Pseudomonas syringae pv. actinidiae ICMP 19079]
MQWSLFGALNGTAPEVLTEAANRAALGDLQSAIDALPGQSDLLHQHYATAFRNLLFILSVASVLTAAAVFTLLGRVHAHEELPQDSSSLAGQTK